MHQINPFHQIPTMPLQGSKQRQRKHTTLKSQEINHPHCLLYMEIYLHQHRINLWLQIWIILNTINNSTLSIASACRPRCQCHLWCPIQGSSSSLVTQVKDTHPINTEETKFDVWWQRVTTMLTSYRPLNVRSRDPRQKFFGHWERESPQISF